MTDLDLATPQARIAADFMHRKGLDVQPHAIERIERIPCWYFYYTLPEGELELEVFYEDARDEWEAVVTCFPMAV